MKKVLYALIVAVVFISCKNSEEKTEATEEEVVQTGAKASAAMPTYRGEFILSDNAAVLKGSDFIYGVKIDDVSRELAAQVAPVKNDEFDMVGVVVKGVLTKKEAGAEGWEDVLTIVEIIKVNDKPAEADIKIEETKE